MDENRETSSVFRRGGTGPGRPRAARAGALLAPAGCGKRDMGYLLFKSGADGGPREEETAENATLGFGFEWEQPEEEDLILKDANGKRLDNGALAEGGY